MTIRLWFIRETDKARLYCKFDPIGRGNTEPDAGDLIWVPRSIVEHTSKRGNEHTVELPDWFLWRKKIYDRRLNSPLRGRTHDNDA